METKLHRSLGIGSELDQATKRKILQQHINLKLAAMGYEMPGADWDPQYQSLTRDLLRSYQERTRLLHQHLCPIDQRIQAFLDDYLDEPGKGKEKVKDAVPRLPSQTFVLDRHGIARELSLPSKGTRFSTEQLESYRVRQGVLHNPKNDRRTTAGSFHIAEDGLPIPADKLAVPRRTYRALLKSALNPPPETMVLPYTSECEKPLRTFVSLMLRPIVCPEVVGYTPEKTMEVRFLAPGTLASNLDFVESIFGNAGDPELAENDAALDCEHWTGHTGCVILAPHLITLRKKDVGLPAWDKATEQQRAQGMAWKSPEELYNNGSPFKLTCRDARGVIVTLIADNYYGYCKKEVKTQISMSANLFGLCEEEHAGGAIAFPSFNLGDEFEPGLNLRGLDHAFEEVVALYGDMMDVQPSGYAIDKKHPDIYYIPEDSRFNVPEQTVKWHLNGEEQFLKLRPNKTYMYPTGYKVHFEQHPGAPSWRLVGTVAEGTFCHKPCTVSGGGKSEISKSLSDAFIFGPFYVANLQEDLDEVEKIINRNYSDRFKIDPPDGRRGRPLLSPQRSLGSVIKLLTPSPTEFTKAYNTWLKGLPQHIRALVFIIKRFYKPEWGDNWRELFSVDEMNGWPGHELKFQSRRLVAIYLRVGTEQNGVWRTYKLRQDFLPAEKLQQEDDISASIVVPSEQLEGLNREYKDPSVKIVANCEYRFFQRPDDAVHRGYDRQAESDMAQDGNFIVNFAPLPVSVARDMVDDAVAYSEYTKPMQDLIRGVADDKTDDYFVCSSAPRIVDGAPSKNPRYLQVRPGMVDPRARYLGEVGTRLRRRVAPGAPVHFPVNAVLGGRRNNPPDAKAGIRALAVYNPIHYQELPELFMDFVCSLTGKSPSTTGAGSEGALTKGPFNCLMATSDLNNALVNFILTGHAGFTSAAGYIGPRYRVDHDISLLIPELWCRMDVSERLPSYLIENRFMEKIDDFEFEGKTILASRLGYRITERFVRIFFGRIFDNPTSVFNDEMLQPETQDLAVFADGVCNIVEAQERVASGYFADGSIEGACPPLKALLHVMAHGHYEGKSIHDPEIRRMFTRDYLLASDWYQERLAIKQEREVALWERHVSYLKNYLRRSSHVVEAERLHLAERLASARTQLKHVKSAAYLESLRGTLGADPIFGS